MMVILAGAKIEAGGSLSILARLFLHSHKTSTDRESTEIDMGHDLTTKSSIFRLEWSVKQNVTRNPSNLRLFSRMNCGFNEIFLPAIVMPFSEKTKLLAKQKAAFRCCLCHKPFVEIHHIIPQSEGGADKLDNAAPLCASCHDLYGGNPEKRKTIRQMRDYWWNLIEKRSKNITELFDLEKNCEIQGDKNWEGSLHSSEILIYHVIFEEENFEDSASAIHRLMKSCQDESPNVRRVLYLDIDGHRNENGGFDHDMYELQKNFLLGFLAPYFTKIYMPLGIVTNKEVQWNNIPNQIEIFGTLDQKSINEAIDKGLSGIWVADKDKLMKFE
jgi:hypothetical protein